MKRDTPVRRRGPSRAAPQPQLRLPAPPPPEPKREREPKKKPSKEEGEERFIVDFRVDSYV